MRVKVHAKVKFLSINPSTGNSAISFYKLYKIDYLVDRYNIIVFSSHSSSYIKNFKVPADAW